MADVSTFKPQGPVPFDFGVAGDLAAKLRASANLVAAQQLPRRRELARTARDGWAGKYADIFDTRTGQCTSDAERLAEALRDAAITVEQLIEEAKREQQRRDLANAYLNEHAAWRERERIRREDDVDSLGDLWDWGTAAFDEEPVAPEPSGPPPPLPVMDPNIGPRE